MNAKHHYSYITAIKVYAHLNIQIWKFWLVPIIFKYLISINQSQICRVRNVTKQWVKPHSSPGALVWLNLSSASSTQHCFLMGLSSHSKLWAVSSTHPFSREATRKNSHRKQAEQHEASVKKKQAR